MVQRASSLNDVYNIFEPKALTEDQKEFYQPTAAVRVGKEHEFHDYLFERIKRSHKNSHILVVANQPNCVC